MQPKRINLETSTIEELKVVVYDLMGERETHQNIINEINKQSAVFNQAIREKEQKQNTEIEAPVVLENVNIEDGKISGKPNKK